MEDRNAFRGGEDGKGTIHDFTGRTLNKYNILSFSIFFQYQ